LKIFLLLISIINISTSTDPYLFSVIISIYNSGRYLEETIDSIINQTIGFEKIQIILVNDGSTDNSDEICMKYQNLFKNNIIYSKIIHGGVSKARNIGLNLAKGLYINFLDSDDKWDCHAFENVYLFFKFYKNIDIVSGRMKYFETNNNYHLLDYKFKKTRVVNLTEEYNCIQLSSSSSFFKKFSIKGKKFEEGVLFGEDIRFITNILIIKPILGLLKEAIYFYRKRSDSTSAIQNTEENRYYYFKNIINVQQYLINESIALYKKILPFIQYFIAYETIFRLKSKAYKFLEINSYKRYCKIIENLLKQIDDKYILEQKIFPSKLLIFALSKKYNKDIRYDINLINQSFIYSNYIMINLKKYKNIIVWKIIEIKGNRLHMEGEDRCWLPKDKYFYFCQLGNNIYFPQYRYFSGYDFVTMYGVAVKGRIVVFDFTIEIKDQINLQFFLSFQETIVEIFPALDQFTHIPPIKNSYYITENYIIKNDDKNLIIYPYKYDLQNSFELEYCLELKKLYKDHLISLRNKHMEELRKNQNNKKFQLWIINDRKVQGGDNGEYFFRYLNQRKPKRIRYYFLISKNCPDYNRLQNFDNILDINSSKYLKLFLKADKIISSVSEAWVYNPFGEEGKYIIDLYHFEFIYLQNGVIKDDLSQNLNKIIKKFDLLITSSKKEYKSFFEYNYGYKENNIALTGLSRFDNLKKLQKDIKIENVILIFPTWRSYIRGTRNLITHESIHSDSFKKTDFFNFYNNLINDDNLLNVMEKNNYIGIFCLHPNFADQYRYFKGNKIFKIKEKCNEQELLIKSALLITDYSSIFFDFGYILKPVIYTQFDYKKYRFYQFPKGYFDYKKDGFGPICYDLQCAIKAVIFEIKNKCKLKKIYLMRIKRFFEYFDENNNFRIYKEILKEKGTCSNNISKIILFSFIIFIKIKIIIRKIYKYKFL